MIRSSSIQNSYPPTSLRGMKFCHALQMLLRLLEALHLGLVVMWVVLSAAWPACDSLPLLEHPGQAWGPGEVAWPALDTSLEKKANFTVFQALGGGVLPHTGPAKLLTPTRYKLRHACQHFRSRFEMRAEESPCCLLLPDVHKSRQLDKSPTERLV